MKNAFNHPFWFLRHGETDWNRERRTQGQLDTPLNALGRRQAAAAAERLKGESISRIVASPLSRVRETAEAVARAVDAPLSFDDGLKEVHLGELQGHPHDERIIQFWRGGFSPKGGETMEGFTERVWAAMARHVAEGPDVLIIAHGGLWRAARDKTPQRPIFSMPNCLPVRVTPSPEGWLAEALPTTEVDPPEPWEEQSI